MKSISVLSQPQPQLKSLVASLLGGYISAHLQPEDDPLSDAAQPLHHEGSEPPNGRRQQERDPRRERARGRSGQGRVLVSEGQEGQDDFGGRRDRDAGLVGRAAEVGRAGENFFDGGHLLVTEILIQFPASRNFDFFGFVAKRCVSFVFSATLFLINYCPSVIL